MPKVLAIILNHNSKEYLVDCISSVKNQSYPDVKILLVDNASTDGSVEVAKMFFPDIDVLTNKSNIGLGNGFNVALRKYVQDFDFFVLMNSDVILQDNWCDILVNYLEKNENVWSVNGVVTVGDSDIIDNAGGQILNIFFGIFIGYLGNDSLSKMLSSKLSDPLRVFFSICNSMIIRKVALNKIGYFDPSYFMYFEDIDLSWRILLSGHEIHCCPGAISKHFGGSSKKGKILALNLVGNTERNLLATYYKNLNNLNLFYIFPILLLARFVGAILYVFIQPKVTVSKISGILKFFKSFNYYKHERLKSQKLRVASDGEIFRSNPDKLVSIKKVFPYIFPWLGRIKQFVNE